MRKWKEPTKFTIPLHRIVDADEILSRDLSNSRQKLPPISSTSNERLPESKGKWSKAELPSVVKIIRQKTTPSPIEKHDDYIDVLDMYEDPSEAEETVKHNMNASEEQQKSQVDHSIELSYVSRINSLETQLANIKHTKDLEVDLLLSEITNECAKFSTVAQYLMELCLIEYLRQQTFKEGSPVYWKHGLIAMENKLGILPDTDLHALIERDLSKLLRQKAFQQARDLLAGIVKRLPQRLITVLLKGSFDYTLFVIYKWECLDALDRGNNECALKILMTDLSHLLQSSTDIYRHAMVSECSDMLSYFPDSISQLQACQLMFAHFGLVISNRRNITSFNYAQELSRFWENAIKYHRFKFFTARDGDNRLFLFVGTYCVDRRVALEAFGMRPSFADIGTKLLEYDTLKHKLIRGDIKVPSNNRQGIIAKDLATMQCADMAATNVNTPLPKRPTPEKRASLQSLPSNISLVSDFAQLRNVSELVACHDTIEAIEVAEWHDSDNMYIVACSYKNKKIMSFWKLEETRGSFNVYHLYDHQVKRPPSCICFHPSEPVIMYEEYSNIILLNYESKLELFRANIHRNVILQLSFLPVTLDRKPVAFASLGFDHCIKISALNQRLELLSIDRVHSSTMQVFTSFCFRQVHNDRYELVAALEKMEFRVYKLRNDGSLHQVQVVQMDCLSFSPKVVTMLPLPNSTRMIVACESDNRLLLVDMASNTLITQFCARGLQLDKRPKPRLNDGLLVVGSRILQPQPPQEKRKSRRNILAEKRVRSQETVTQLPKPVFLWQVDGKQTHVSSAIHPETIQWLPCSQYLLISQGNNWKIDQL